ncbi:hypothetical protein NQ317_017159 [Molorchus minor]|uniref:Uncharacterized protein n=1 Tax=Molorchus minor TaxID=1323400 RepID=A0ABQ9J0F0_9CUCU|nr:hypothetical protein NQ317_017159 [Molorchus minor]
MVTVFMIIEGRGLRLAGYLTPPSDVTAAEEEEETLEQWSQRQMSTNDGPQHDFPKGKHALPLGGNGPADIELPTPILEQTWVSRTEVPTATTQTTIPVPAQQKDYTALTISHSAPASHQASFERGRVWRGVGRYPRNQQQPLHGSQNRVSHATSLDAITRRQCFRTGYPTVTLCYSNRPSSFALANKPQLNKQFPNVSSESDLQRYRTAQQSNDRRSPTPSNPTDSLKQKRHRATLRRMWMQHDGAPPHYAVQVRRYLNETFPKQMTQ